MADITRSTTVGAAFDGFAFGPGDVVAHKSSYPLGIKGLWPHRWTVIGRYLRESGVRVYELRCPNGDGFSVDDFDEVELCAHPGPPPAGAGPAPPAVPAPAPVPK